jgi:hypothetical protein
MSMLMMRRWLLLIVLSSSPLIVPIAAQAGGIVPIGPFVGTDSENFDNTGVDGATQTLSVFGGLATIQNLTSGGALKVERSSSLDGLLQVPRSAPWMVGQLGIAEWTFAQPVSEFGGYFANNSRFNDAVVDFYDPSGSRIGELSATIPNTPLTWTWNGWRSDKPIGSVVITGNDAGFLHGFIWYDDFQLTVAPNAVPEPGSLVLLATAGLVLAPWACRTLQSGCRQLYPSTGGIAAPMRLTHKAGSPCHKRFWAP